MLPLQRIQDGIPGRLGYKYQRGKGFLLPNNNFVWKEACKRERNYLDFKIAMQFLYVPIIQHGEKKKNLREVPLSR